MEPIEEPRLLHTKQESEMSVRHLSITKEESSDDSTIISSQTSTLTRNQDCESFQPINIKYEDLVNCLQNVGSCDSDDSDEDDDDDDDEDDEEEEGVAVEFRPNEKLEVVLEDDCAETIGVLKKIMLTPNILQKTKKCYLFLSLT